MKKLILLTAMTLLVGGCCGAARYLPQIQGTTGAVQQYYDSLYAAFMNDQTDATIRQAMVAADTTLATARLLAAVWCPELRDAEQLRVQLEEARFRAWQVEVQGKFK
jgi:hypothetical protein